MDLFCRSCSGSGANINIMTLTSAILCFHPLPRPRDYSRRIRGVYEPTEIHRSREGGGGASGAKESNTDKKRLH